ncbi:FkbM family methyltransferase [Azospirillum sp.]|uniref:FkbM family methyltransferase n=1 Tax=Azospirillum sp. TaxID=34012 RepID=UPI002D5E0B80|nr:FkbM family methyltransferase [Azospirillum sp.]HYD63872.1 FkbM family methyltransferase [Azospirillum sp.]
MEAQVLDSVLTATGLTPVLLDIGCSGPALPIWQPIKQYSYLIGYDPDDRDIDRGFGEGFRQAALVQAAVCDNDRDQTMRIVLTAHPSCSSHLYPNDPVLAHYCFHEFFEVKREVQVRATSLNRTLEELRLPQIDWIKVDAQGCDLRILRNLHQDAFDRLVAVDTEPGFHEYYQTEDQFHVIHDYLINNGFWLAQLDHQRYARTRPDTVRYLTDLVGAPSPAALLDRLGKSPTAAEARYLRTIEHVLRLPPRPRERAMLLLFAFSVLIKLPGFAADVMLAYQSVIGKDHNSALMEQALLSLLGAPTAVSPA